MGLWAIKDTEKLYNVTVLSYLIIKYSRFHDLRSQVFHEQNIEKIARGKTGL